MKIRKTRARRRVAMTRDGILARRMDDVMDPESAERMASTLNRLPTILHAWTERVSRRGRRIVCWLPATPRADESMHHLFLAGEAAKAETEGVAFVWSPTVFGPNARCCYNPRSRRAYLVVRTRGEEGDWQYRCQCPRFQSAGLCKHALDALLRERFDP